MEAKNYKKCLPNCWISMKNIIDSANFFVIVFFILRTEWILYKSLSFKKWDLGTPKFRGKENFCLQKRNKNNVLKKLKREITKFIILK